MSLKVDLDLGPEAEELEAVDMQGQIGGQVPSTPRTVAVMQETEAEAGVTLEESTTTTGALPIEEGTATSRE